MTTPETVADVHALPAKWRAEAKEHFAAGRSICANMTEGLADELERSLAGAVPVGVLRGYVQEDDENGGPLFDPFVWQRLREFPAGTILYTHLPAVAPALNNPDSVYTSAATCIENGEKLTQPTAAAGVGLPDRRILYTDLDGGSVYGYNTEDLRAYGDAREAAAVASCQPFVLPLESASKVGLTCDDLLSEWVPGSVKPAEHGTYLRQFPGGELDLSDETEALSCWNGIDTWTMGTSEDFFANASPDQDMAWRGVDPRKLIDALTTRPASGGRSDG